MKRIALIRNSYSHDVGGAEIFPINLAKILVKKGYEPVLLSSNLRTLNIADTNSIDYHRSPWWSLQNYSGVRVFLFPIYIVWSMFVSIWYLLFIIRSRIDIIHPQSRDDFIAATIAGRLLRKKVIWVDHADLKHIYRNHRVWYKNPIGKLTYIVSRYADKILIESHSEKKLIEESLGKTVPKNYSVVHIGVVDSYVPKIKKNDKITLISTSRLVIDKGITELIEAIKLVGNPKITMKICGDGPDASRFKELAKDANGIEFLGHVDDIATELSKADILIHPTYHEGFGLSLVEAEMCQLPIIASNVGSIPEIVKDGVNGILVPPKNSKALALAITELSSDPKKRKKMGEASRKIFLDNFQFDQIVTKHFIPLYN